MAKIISEVFRKVTTRIKSIAFHPTAPIIITAHHCGTINIWNYLYKQITTVLEEHAGSVRVVKIHPAGELFATAGNDKIVRIWNYKTKTVIHRLKGHTDYVRSLDFHPTRPWIISGSDDCTIKIWDFYTGQMICSSSGHSHYVMDVLFVDSTHIITGSLDHTIALWSCSNLFEKKNFLSPGAILTQQIDAHERGINCLFVRDGDIMSGSDDREIKLWKYCDENLHLEETIYSHENNITAVYCDDMSFYGVGEDSHLSIFTKGKSKKINVESRIWCLNGKNEYLALGTDDGLVMFRNQADLIFASDGKQVIYLSNTSIMKYNFKQTMEYCKISGAVQRLLLNEGRVIVQYNERFDVLLNGTKEEGETGSVICHGADKYILKDENLYKNDDLFRSAITGILFTGRDGIFIVNGKALTYISNDQEASVVFNFVIKDVQTHEEAIAVFGTNKILLLDQKLNIFHTISELVEITGGFFHNEILIYVTLKQIKFFYEDQGILQSIDMYCKPICVDDDYLLLLSHKGIEKIFLNLSEIRFRRAVLNDENILSVIETEQLPGLSPLEYLIQKGKGGIALPYIKDTAKRFELFLSENLLDEAYKLCEDNKMYNALAFKALACENYEVAENCLKKAQDHLNLFFLFLCTKQFEKMKDLEGEEIENMVKVVLEDRSILATSQEGELVQDVGNMRISNASFRQKSGNKTSMGTAVKTSKSFIESEESKSTAVKTSKNSIESEESKSTAVKIGKSVDSKITKDNANASDKVEDDSSHETATSVYTDLLNMSVPSNESPKTDERKRDDEDDLTSNESCVRTDYATINDSSFHSQIFDLSDLSLKGEDREIDVIYNEALQLTTKGKFCKAAELFKTCIWVIATKVSRSNDFIDLRKMIGNYLLGLNVEKIRRTTNEPIKNIQMSLFFSSLPLEDAHKVLAMNLAMTTCFKYGNTKTAKEIARNYPEGINAVKILECDANEDKYEIKKGDLCFDTMKPEKNVKECALCFVKSKNGEKCRACEIGILQ